MRMRLGPLVAALVVAATVCVTALAGSQATPGVTKTKFVIGATFPLSGPAAYYSPIPVGMKVYFTYVNATRGTARDALLGEKGGDKKRGVSGRQIVWKYYDDGYNPANTAQQTRKLVEEDHVFALFGGLGTEPQQAVVAYANERKVPQLLVSTGATEFDAKYSANPYTIGWQPDYFAEGRIYGKYAAATWPDKKIGVLYQNDDYGKNYLDGLRDGLGTKASNIVLTVGVAATDPSVLSQVSQLKASGAAVIAILATPSPTVKTFATMKALKYKPEQVILNSVSANDYVMDLALKNSDASTLDGTISSAYLMNSNDPKYANKASVKLYKAQMAKWAPKEDPKNTFFYYGFAKAYDVVKLLAATGKNPTRAKVLNAARHMNWANPFTLPGIKVTTSATDPFPISQVKLIKYDGNAKIWSELGSLINGRGGT
jgi:branched-chain amino acid transport system substrate-binding protein